MHLKYRFTSLDEFVGNDQLKKVLKSIDYKSPIFFEGPTGCGKTSLSYIIARNYGANPLTIREINCGYYTKIETMREEIDNLNKSSLFGNKKALILSEVHKLSPASQNAWLIPLENLSESILVIGNTIYTNSLLQEFMDRFLRFKVRSLTTKESLLLLNKVCEKENIVLPKWLQSLIITKSDGIPRRILTSVSKVRDINNEEDAKYLLDKVQLEERIDVLSLFKLLLVKASWKLVKKELSNLLKTKTPNDISMSLINIVAGRLSSDYIKDKEEGKNLLLLIDCLRDSSRIPEESNLKIELFRFCNNNI